MNIIKYIPSSDRGSISRCDACGVDLMRCDFAFEVERPNKFYHYCENCFGENIIFGE